MTILTATNTYHTPTEALMRLPEGTSEFQYFGREVFLRRTYDYLLKLLDKERVLKIMEGFIPKDGYSSPDT
jgi:hypothetical protein